MSVTRAHIVLTVLTPSFPTRRCAVLHRLGLRGRELARGLHLHQRGEVLGRQRLGALDREVVLHVGEDALGGGTRDDGGLGQVRSEEHTSELQSLMLISSALFSLKKKTRRHESNSSK